MRLDDLLAELQSRLEAVPATRDRVHALLEAVVSIGSDLDLETVLRRIVAPGCRRPRTSPPGCCRAASRRRSSP
ncbi:hypothetical protein [Microbispora sp. H10949]|nr:hypothetical protein [Microbispora sp. H10949]